MYNSKLSNITQKWVDILSPFTKNYYISYNSSDLSKITKIPQQTISRVLNDLHLLNLIEFNIQGKNKMFNLNLNKLISLNLLNMIENKKSIDFSLNHPEILIIIEDLLVNCEAILLFGSFASNTFNENSDLDIIILNVKNKQNIKKIKKKYLLELNEEYLSFDEFESELNNKNNLALEIKKNHLIFGDISKLINIFIKNAKR